MDLFPTARRPNVGELLRGPPELSTAIEDYVALRFAGDPLESANLQRAARFILDARGVEKSRVFTRRWLSLFDLWSWADLPVLSPALMFRLR
jgi:squalene-hopene/tetraprenyl-beta-curcumene cyclase